MSRLTVGNYLGLSVAMIKLSIASAMEYRFSFMLQIIGMIVNDAALIIVWIIFFQRFPSVSGWVISDIFLLYSVITVSFALMQICCRGVFELSKLINRAELDRFFCYPHDLLWQITVDKSDISGFGDLIFGIILFFFSGPVSVTKIGIYLTVVFLSTLIFYSFVVITQSLSFFIENFEETAEQLFNSLIGLTLYPQNIFSGGLKFITLTLLPAFFVAQAPVSLLQSFDLTLFGILLIVALVSLVFAKTIFRIGLKRYESGNLIGIRL